MTSRGLAYTLGALVALAYASVLVGGQTFADARWLGQVTPERFAAGDAIARGELPAWWHEAGFGAPLLAEGTHGALYPPTWLAGVGHGMLDLVAIAHLWLLAVGTAMLAGRLGADAPGKLLAGAAAALAAVTGGALVGGALFSLAWSPLAAERAFALMEAGSRNERVRGVLAVAACLALAGLGGAPPVADGTIATVIVIGAVVGGGWLGTRDSGGWRGAARGAAWCLAAAAGSLALAAVQIAPALIHAASGHAVGPEKVWPGIRLIELVAPGSTSASGALLGGGAAVIALASLARTRWLAWPAALVVAAAVGVVPPALAWVWLAALAGAGLTTLTKEPPARATWIAAATVAGAMAAVWAATAALRNSIARSVDAAGLDGPTIVEHAIRRGGIAVGFAAATVALALVAAQRKQAALVAGAALVALVEIVLASRAALPRQPRNERPALVAALEGIAPARVFRNKSAAAADASAAPLGIAAIPGRDPARLRVEDRLPAATAGTASRILDRYSIPYAIVPTSIIGPAGLREIASAGDDALVAVDPRRTRAFWAAHWRHVDDDTALDALAPPPGRTAAPLGTVFVAGTGDAGGDDLATPHPCTLARPADAEVRLACDVTAPGYAVILDAWAPGWSATVDGRAVPVERADLVARAVRVGPGARAIVFRYTPPGFWLGTAISALAFLNAVLLLVLGRRPRSGHERDGK